ncbi:MAG: oligoribonuclease [Bradymonadia bacterium]
MQNLDIALLWIDLEMTGLNPQINHIIEIASIITDLELNIIATGPEFAIYRSEDELNTMDKWNWEHHTESGLVERVRKSSTSVAQAEAATLEFLQIYAKPRKAILCGNSVWQDRRFLNSEMPTLEEYLHYRQIDVSSIKELAKAWLPELPKFQKNNAHRALDDILESIEELRYYKEKIFLRLAD